MNYAALDAAIAALATHKDECIAEQAESRIAGSITDEYHRALNHDEEHLRQIVTALDEQRAMKMLTQAKINEILAYLRTVRTLNIPTAPVPLGDL